MKKKYVSPELELLEMEVQPLLEASTLDLNGENATDPAMSREDEEFFGLFDGAPF